MSSYDIKITGSGTVQELIDGLEAVVANLKGGLLEESISNFHKAEWEDETLMTEICESDG